MTQVYNVGWWNLENLFDSERARRTQKLRRALGRSVNGWTADLRNRKIAQLSSAVAGMNTGRGPDLLGVCEVENRTVLNLLKIAIERRLPSRRYGIIHADTRDQRGIDVAFLYDRALFDVPRGEVFQHVVMRRTATREILQVNFRTRLSGRTWTVFGNHWPSRRGGPTETSGYRMIAGETLAYFHQRALEVHGADTPALAMGDFNDDPFAPSLVVHTLATNQRQRVMRTRSVPRFLNLSWPLVGQGDGTFFFDSSAFVFDQFLVNKNLLRTEGALRAIRESLQIVRLAGMTNQGAYPKPRPFGGMGSPVDRNGFSDHFPIAVDVVEDE